MGELKFIKCPECGRHYVSIPGDPDFDILWHLTREHGYTNDAAKTMVRGIRED